MYGHPKNKSNRLGTFFAQYVKVGEVEGVAIKSGIATGDIVLEITLTCKSFAGISNILMCRERRIFAVVEGRRPYCWSCGASEHMVHV